MKDISDPAVFGPGAWLIMHFLAKHCDFIVSVKTCLRLYLYSLLCIVCQEHALEFLSQFPIEKATSLFEWTVKFHNHANRKTNKKEVSLEEASHLLDLNLSNSAKFGPGVWIFFAVISRKASNIFEKSCVLKIISFICESFSKLPAWKEARLFNADSFREACFSSLENALFKEIYQFHNAVNVKLSRELIPYDKILEIYEGRCEKNCGSN